MGNGCSSTRSSFAHTLYFDTNTSVSLCCFSIQCHLFTPDTFLLPWPFLSPSPFLFILPSPLPFFNTIVFESAVTKGKREGRSGKRAEGFQEFTVAKETTTLKLWKKSGKGCPPSVPPAASSLQPPEKQAMTAPLNHGERSLCQER